MNLIYFAYGNVSVFDSQVVTLLNHYIESNLISGLKLVIGIRSRKEREKYFNKGINKKIEIIFYKHFPQYPFVEKLTIRSIINVLKKIKTSEKYIFHVRNDVLSYYVYKALKKLKINNPRIISDIRGAGYAQIIEYSKKNRILIILKYFQRKHVYKVLKQIKNISVISESLKNYITNNLKDNSLNIVVNPCIAAENFRYNSSSRIEIRKKLGLQNSDILFVLSAGSNSAWQNINLTISSLANRGLKVLNMSNNCVKHQNVTNIFVDYSEVPKYLCASDIAIIWRGKSVTNQVASPVKFSEYICSGLPVITNKSVDLITSFIMENNCGRILDTFEDLDMQLLESLIKMDRAKISNIGMKYFGVHTISSQYFNFYQTILNSTKEIK